MKKMIVALTVIAALSVAPSARAETVVCSSQYGGSTCGASTNTETTVTRMASTGVSDWSLAQIVGITGLVAVAATALYKLTYRSYLLG